MNPYRDILQNFTIDTIARIRRRFVQVSGAKVRGGSAWKSLDESRVTNTAAEIWGVNYFYWLNEGRGPTERKNQGGPTLREILIPWVKKTLRIFDDIKAKGLAYVIARNIHEKGWVTNPEKREARMVTAFIKKSTKELEAGIDKRTQEIIDASIFKGLGNDFK